ncbi:MAG: hypothetical protein CMJ65_06810 [Planctomycetaceae bacterium]|nr:hypothetical protein [Planctomycetaceae bacterium]
MPAGVRQGCVVVAVLALVAAVLGYIENRPAAISLAWSALAGAAALLWWKPDWILRPGYRILLVFLGPAVVLGAWEASGLGVADQHDLYIRGRVNYADVMIRTFPDRDGYRFLKAQQLGMCLNYKNGSPPAFCRTLEDVNVERVLGELERAIATGVTSNGDLLRIYTEALEEAGAPAAAVARARAEYLTHHPVRGYRDASRTSRN